MKGGLIILALVASASVSAQDARVVLTLESTVPSVRADALRASLSESLQRPVVSLADAREHELHVVVVVGAAGPASVMLRAPNTQPRLLQIARTSDPDWVLQGLMMALSNDPDELRPSALRSWSGVPQRAARQSLLLPWPEAEIPAPSRGRYLIVRTWPDTAPAPDPRAPESGGALSTPEPGGS